MKRVGISAASIFVLGLATIWMAGCDRLPPSKPLSELTPRELACRQVFLARCSRCHYPDSRSGLQGPGLKGLFRRPYLPSGTPANDEHVMAVILQGRNMMPAQAGALDDRQLNDLMEYLHTL